MTDGRDRIRAWLNQALAKTGLKPAQLARAAGLAPSTITRFLNNPGHKFNITVNTADKIDAVVSQLLRDVGQPNSLPPFPRINLPMGSLDEVEEARLLGLIRRLTRDEAEIVAGLISKLVANRRPDVVTHDTPPETEQNPNGMGTGNGHGKPRQ